MTELQTADTQFQTGATISANAITRIAQIACTAVKAIEMRLNMPASLNKAETTALDVEGGACQMWYPIFAITLAAASARGIGNSANNRSE